EIALLDECTVGVCKIKFDDEELKRVTGASHQYRLHQFKKEGDGRLEDFRKNGRLHAYEGTHAPQDWQDLTISPVIPTKFNTTFWLPHNRDQYGYDILDSDPGHFKPVVGLFSRQCEQRGEGVQTYTVCTDLILYNNHYFDFWA